MTVHTQQSTPVGACFEVKQVTRKAPSDACTAYRTWPREGTNRRRILDALLSGDTLTSADAWERLGAARLAADVHQLRRDGWPIEAESIEVVCRGGRRAIIARYWLEGADE